MVGPLRNEVIGVGEVGGGSKEKGKGKGKGIEGREIVRRR